MIFKPSKSGFELIGRSTVPWTLDCSAAMSVPGKAAVCEIELYIDINPNPNSKPAIHGLASLAYITSMNMHIPHGNDYWESGSYRFLVHGGCPEIEFSGKMASTEFIYTPGKPLDIDCANPDDILSAIERLLTEYAKHTFENP